MVLIRLALLACLALPAAAQEAAPFWVAEVRLAPVDRAAPAFARMLRESAGARVAEAQAALNGAAPPILNLSLRDSIAFASPEFISVRRAGSRVAGGAHPESWVKAWSWDVAENRLASIADMVQGQAGLQALAAALRKAARDMAHGGEADSFWTAAIDDAIRPDAAALTRFTLTPSTEAGKAAGLDFHFSPYEIGPYAAGAPALHVGMDVLAPLLTERARRIFGGDKAE